MGIGETFEFEKTGRIDSELSKKEKIVDGLTEMEYIRDICQVIFCRHHDINSKEIPHIIDCITQCFDRGFSAWDAYCYTKRTEHVNPDLPEEVALREMNAIAAKYGNRK